MPILMPVIDLADQTCRVTVYTHITSTLLSSDWAPLLMLSQLYT